MRPRDIALIATPGAPTVAPDGRHAVVAVTRPDLSADAYRSGLLLVPLDPHDGEPRPLTHGPRDTAPAYSPDGRWLAFLRAPADGPAQVHLLPVGGGEPVQVSEHPLGAGAPVWAPDSRRLAYTARVPEPGRYGTAPTDHPEEKPKPEQEAPRRITGTSYRLDGVGFTTDRRAHVFVLDAVAAAASGRCGEPTQLTSADADHADPAWSPDGQLVAFASARHPSRDDDLATDIWVAPAAGEDARALTRTDLGAGHPVLSADGSTVFFLAAEHPEQGGHVTGVFAVPLDGSAPPRRLTPAEGPDAVDASDAALTCALVPRSDGGLLVGTARRGRLELLTVPADGSTPTVVAGGERQIRGFVGVPGSVRCVVVAADATSGGEVLVLGDDAEPRVLTRLCEPLARGSVLVEPVEVTATAGDGYPVHGWVYLPSGPGPHPVLLMIHGGPVTQYGWGLLDEAQVYAGAGYAVVMGNPRGSSGYGQDHTRAVLGAFGDRDAVDLLALLDAALERPELDRARVGVLGGSYGGWMTAHLLGAHPHRWRAGVSERGVYAFDSFLGSSDIGVSFSRAFAGGTDWETLRAQSPLFGAESVRCPVLVIHSEQDWRCPLEQGQRWYTALRLAGVPAEMLIFPGEGHELSRSGLPSHRVARFEAILDFFGKHLAA